MQAADPLLRSNMKNGEFGSENKMLESIIIDSNYVVVGCASVFVLPFIPKPRITLHHDINRDVEKYFVIQDHICDLGQDDIIVTVLVSLSHTLDREC